MFSHNGSGVMVSGDSSSNMSSTGNISNTGSIDRIDTIRTIQSKNNTRGQISSQVQGDSSKLQVFRQQASTISQALWPGNLQRSEALGKASHRRRHMLINTRLSNTRSIEGTQVMPDYAPWLLVGTAVIVVGSIVLTLLLHRWFILLIPVFMLTLTTLLMLQSFYERMQGNARQHGRLFIQQTPQTFKSFPGISGVPTSRRAFDTPMPKTPLVRELETYDLSQTSVEHFLDAHNARDSKEHAIEK